MPSNLPKLVLFDLDGTLCPSKMPVDEEMAAVLSELLSKTKVGIISGGRFERFRKQIIEPIGHRPKLFLNLMIFPTMGGSLFLWGDKDWKEMYQVAIPDEKRKKIIEAFAEAFKETSFKQPEKIYGEQIEERGPQVTFSALGQTAPLAEKEIWDPDMEKRRKLKAVLDRILPEYQISMGGLTSIDITMKGIDKGYAVEQALKYTQIPITEMLFIGDKLEEGGNDYSVVRTGIKTHAVKTPEETKKFLKKLLSI